MNFTQIKKAVAPVQPKEVTIDANGQTITFKVKQYLPQEQKYKIIKQTVATSIDDVTGIIDHFIVDMMFCLAVVYEYTDISFTKLQQDEGFLETYDTLETLGIISAVVDAIPEQEYAKLVEFLEQNLAEVSKFHQSIGSVTSKMNDFIDKMTESVKNLDIEQIQQGLNGIKPLLNLITTTKEIKEGIE